MFGTVRGQLVHRVSPFFRDFNYDSGNYTPDDGNTKRIASDENLTTLNFQLDWLAEKATALEEASYAV